MRDNKKIVRKNWKLEKKPKISLLSDFNVSFKRYLEKYIFSFAKHLKKKNHDKPFYDSLEIMDYLKNMEKEQNNMRKNKI